MLIALWLLYAMNFPKNSQLSHISLSGICHSNIEPISPIFPISLMFGYFMFVAIADFPKHRECQFVWAYWSLWSGYDLGRRPGSLRLCRCRYMTADADVDMNLNAIADRTWNPERIRSSSVLILLFMAVVFFVSLLFFFLLFCGSNCDCVVLIAKRFNI